MYLNRLSTELQDLVLVQKVIGSEVLCREPESRDRLEHPSDLLNVRMNQDVQIAGEARRAVISNGVPSHNQELNALFVQ